MGLVCVSVATSVCVGCPYDGDDDLFEVTLQGCFHSLSDTLVYLFVGELTGLGTGTQPAHLAAAGFVFFYGHSSSGISVQDRHFVHTLPLPTLVLTKV